MLGFLIILAPKTVQCSLPCNMIQAPLCRLGEGLLIFAEYPLFDFTSPAWIA
jgi:hypothetical protein